MRTAQNWRVFFATFLIANDWRNLAFLHRNHAGQNYLHCAAQKPTKTHHHCAQPAPGLCAAPAPPRSSPHWAVAPPAWPQANAAWPSGWRTNSTAIRLFRQTPTPAKKRHTPAAACRGACASAAAAQPPGDTCLPGRPTADPSCAVALTAPFRHLFLPFPTPD